MNVYLFVVLVVASACVTLLGCYPAYVRLRLRRLERPAYTCGCGHSLAQHDPTDDGCYAEVERRHYDSLGNFGGYRWVRCTCRRYVGDRPLDPALFAVPLPLAGDADRRDAGS